MKSNRVEANVPAATSRDITALRNFRPPQCERTKQSNPIGLQGFKRSITGLFFAALLFQAFAMAEEAVIEVISLQNRPAAEIQPLLMPLLDANDAVTGDGFNLIIKASPERLENIRSIVEHLDTRLHNLMISVLQSSNKSAEQLNAEAFVVATPSTLRMHGMSGDTRDFDSRRTAQQLRTLEGQPAHIQVGQIRPVETVTIYNRGYGYPGVAINTELQEASTGFAVIPRLQSNNEITLDIAPWSDQFLGRNWIATQSIQTSIRARLGEWIEIGSIGQQEKTDRRGFSGFNYSTHDNERKILIKVDLAD